VKEDRIYNFDEGGIRVGCMRGEWVYAVTGVTIMDILQKIAVR
jgi:hypothetical protein